MGDGLESHGESAALEERMTTLEERMANLELHSYQGETSEIWQWQEAAFFWFDQYIRLASLAASWAQYSSIHAKS